MTAYPTFERRKNIMGGVFPAPAKIIGVAIIVIVTLAIVNNVAFLGQLTKTR